MKPLKIHRNPELSFAYFKKLVLSDFPYSLNAEIFQW